MTPPFLIQLIATWTILSVPKMFQMLEHFRFRLGNSLLKMKLRTEGKEAQEVALQFRAFVLSEDSS